MSRNKIRRTAWVIKDPDTGEIWKPDRAWSPKVWFSEVNAVKALRKLYGGRIPDDAECSVVEVEIIEK